MNRILLMGLFMLIPVLLFAQGPEPADPSTTPGEWYASELGIATATLVLVSVVKKIFGEVSGFNAVPVWVYALLIGGGLTVIAGLVLETLPDFGWQMALQAMQNAAVASGFYGWIDNGSKPLAESAGVTVVAK